MEFSHPATEFFNGGIHFFHLASGGELGRDGEKVVTADQSGRALLYDTQLRSVRPLNSFTRAKYVPVSMTVGKNLYIMDILFTHTVGRDNCFEGLIYNDDDDTVSVHDWYPRALPAPPYAHYYRADLDRDPSHVTSYAVVAGGAELWVSKDSLGTHSFDVESGAWSKAGDWALPFHGHVQHVPEHDLWFGLSTPYGEDTVISTSDLTVTPPTARKLWEDPSPEEWSSISSHLVHLGRSRFCHARFFQILRPNVGCFNYVVFTGLEVERRGEDGDELAVVTHRSVQYDVPCRLMTWVL